MLILTTRALTSIYDSITYAYSKLSSLRKLPSLANSKVSLTIT